MKRIIAAGAVLIMLLGMVTVSAGTAGSSSDPLITLTYLNNTFAAALKNDAAQQLETAVKESLSRLDEIYKAHAGYSFAPRYTSVTLTAGSTIRLTTGGSFTLLSGSASLTVSGGSAINVTTGYEVSSGSLLVINQRYLCAENATVVITASADVQGQLDGYFITDGIINPIKKSVFNDVRVNDWFFPAVSFVYDNGLFAGTSTNTFSPNTPMTRAMFVTVLHRLDGIPAPDISSFFSDVSDPAQYYYNAVLWANANNIVTGYDDGKFMPDNSITREQMSAIIYRYAAYKGLDLTPSGTAYDSFPDKGSVSAYAADAMRWAVAWGVINGSDGKLLPLNTATRAQVAQIMYNFCEKISANNQIG